VLPWLFFSSLVVTFTLCVAATAPTLGNSTDATRSASYGTTSR
jgi:hypothetical protein